MARNYGNDSLGKPVDITRGDLVRFWPADLIAFDDNYRYGATDNDPEVREKREAEIEAMVEDLCRIGQKQPILIHEVSGKRFKVHAGDTRHQAFIRINQRRIWPFNKPNDPPEEKGLARVECKVEENGDGKVTFGASVAENISRNALTVVDISNAIMLAINRYSYTYAEVMVAFRQTDPAFLPNMRRIARLPEQRRREIHLGQMAASIGYILAEIPEERHAEVLAEASGEATDNYTEQLDREMLTPEERDPITHPVYPDGTVAGFSSGIDATPDAPEPERQLDYTDSQVKQPVIQPNKPKRRRVTARAVTKVAKSKGLLTHKKVSKTLAEMRAFWAPLATDRKDSLLGNLAKAQVDWIEGGTDDVFYRSLIEILREKK